MSCWSEDERRLLRRLAVFTGGWTLDLAEEVTAGEGLERLAVLDLLGSLVDKSLVLVEDGEPSTRYRLLETVRQYALDHLGQSPDELPVRDRHRDALLALAEEVEPHLGTADQHLWLRTLAAEDANLTGALEHAAQTDPDKALRLAVALTFYWKLRGRFAAAESGYAQALDAAPADAPLRARALWGRAYLMVYGGGYDAGDRVRRRGPRARRGSRRPLDHGAGAGCAGHGHAPLRSKGHPTGTGTIPGSRARERR